MTDRSHPKTGEPRKTRQPLKIDRLPLAMQDRIRAERIAGRTWLEIEQASPKWEDWKDVPLDVLELFPDLRLPHTNLQRWYDLRIEQTMREQEQQAAAAHAAAEKVAARGFTNLSDSLKNALGEATFQIMNANGDPTLIAAALIDAGRLQVRFERNEIARESLVTERERVSLLAKKLELMKGSVRGLRDEAAKKELTPEQLQQKLDEIYGLGA